MRISPLSVLDKLFLLLCQLLLEAFWHLGGRGTGESKPDFDGVIDEPLKGGEGTDHYDPWC